MKSFRRAPAIFAAGALSVFILAGHSSASDNLSEELFSEKQWEECRAECLRILQLEPENHRAQLTAWKAGTRLGKDHTAQLTSFTTNSAADLQLRCEAHFELADIYQSEERHALALRHLTECFNRTSSAHLFAEATRRANTILNADPILEKQHPELVNVIRTASKTWPRTQKKASPKTAPILARPALWIIGFYQTQIGPAIGSRCSLNPSCSSYAVDALRKHGPTGIAIAGDRMVREPDVVHARSQPIVISDQIKYSDPISAHTFWMQKDEGR